MNNTEQAGDSQVLAGDSRDRTAVPGPRYTFDLSKCLVLDVEIYPPNRWCCGVLSASTGKHRCIDGDAGALAELLAGVADRGATLIGWNSEYFDIPLLRAILAGADTYQVSRALTQHKDRERLPDAVKRALGSWPRIACDHVDLAARTRSFGRIRPLKLVAACLGCRHLRELPYDPTQPVTNSQWAEIKDYNFNDLIATRAALLYFTPELESLAAISSQYGLDLRSTHQAGIARAIMVASYRAARHIDPRRLATPQSVRYHPPAAVRRPSHPVLAAWYDRLVSEAFPMVVPRGEEHPKPVIPEPDGPIILGGLTLSVGSGGLHSIDRRAIYRAAAEFELFDVDASSYYPNLMSTCKATPRCLGSHGAKLFREIIDRRLRLKAEAAAATDPATAKRIKAQSNGLKIIANSLFGQLGNGYSDLYDPEMFLLTTLTGQLALINLVESLIAADAAEPLAINTDGISFSARRDRSGAWREILEDWQRTTGLVLEVAGVQTLIVQSTNHYCVLGTDGTVKRKGDLTDVVDANHVPKFRVVADAVMAALLHGILPEHTVKQCADPGKFVAVCHREKEKAGFLVDAATGAETKVPERTIRWYKAKNSNLRLEHRWADANKQEHRTTPPGATSIQLLMDLPEPGQMPGDVDYPWYIAEARDKIQSFRDFDHLNPDLLADSEVAVDLHRRGLTPCPKWQGKKLPKGAKTLCPSYFWDWQGVDAFGCWTGPQTQVLVLDVDEPHRWAKYLGDLLRQHPADSAESLADCMTSYHRQDTPAAVRRGQSRGKLLFRLKADADHPLARVGAARLKSATGIEVFYGHGVPTILGAHPDGTGHDYMLDGVLGPAPDWLVADLTNRTMSKLPKPKPKPTAPAPADPDIHDDGPARDTIMAYGAAALESEAAVVAETPEGGRNIQLFSSACALGSLVAAGAVDRDEAVAKLVEATTLPRAEAVATITNGLERGAESPRDLGKLQKRRPIVITTVEYRVNRKAVAALRSDPALYQRGNQLVRVLRDDANYRDADGNLVPLDLCRDAGAPRIAPVPPAILRERLTRFAKWRATKVIKGEEVRVPAHPPSWAVDAVLNWGNWDGIRHLEAIVETPVLRPDGTLLEQPGYDPATGLLFEPNTWFPAVAPEPTRAAARAAADTLLALVGDFPFAGPEHRAAWLAALLTPLARFAIKGPVPLFCFDANQARVGKTKLVDLISIVATGRKIARSAFPTSDEEWDKRILSIAMAGTRMILFDNLATGGNLGSASLDAVLTGTSYSGRILGESQWANDIPFTTVLYASGNNLNLTGDILGRQVLSRLESKHDRPEERDDFRVKDLLGHTWARRGELATAVLTLLRAFGVAGRPRPAPQLPPMGEYSAWSALVRGTVYWVVGIDPCATKELARSCDTVAVQLPAVLEGWAKLCAVAGARGLTTALALRHLEGDPEGHADLHAILAELTRDGKLPSPQKLGNYLGKIKGRCHAGRALAATVLHGTNCWEVVRVDQPAPLGDGSEVVGPDDVSA